MKMMGGGGYDNYNNYEEEDDDAAQKKSNSLPIWGNEKTMNLNTLVLTNIQSSQYFKVKLYALKTYHEVIDEIYYQVSHLEPWEKGSRKTAGQTGMCGGVRGVGAGGIVSTAFCILYKLFTLRLTRKQIVGLLNNPDSPYIRGLGFMYIRYTQPPADLWEWLEPYMDDEEEIDVRAGGGQSITIGLLCRQILTKLDWHSTLFPRIPVPIQKDLEKKISARDTREAEEAMKQRMHRQDDWKGGRQAADGRSSAPSNGLAQSRDYDDKGRNSQDHGRNFQDKGRDFQDKGRDFQDKGRDFQDKGRDFQDKFHDDKNRNSRDNDRSYTGKDQDRNRDSGYDRNKVGNDSRDRDSKRVRDNSRDRDKRVRDNSRDRDNKRVHRNSRDRYNSRDRDLKRDHHSSRETDHKHDRHRDSKRSSRDRDDRHKHKHDRRERDGSSSKKHRSRSPRDFSEDLRRERDRVKSKHSNRSRSRSHDRDRKYRK